jgi:lactoylglutathione lyase
MPISLRFEIFPADVNVTADFYTRVLAFELIVDRRARSLPRPEARFRPHRSRRPTDTTVIADRPWGVRDFRLLDPDGYYLRITERVPGRESPKRDQ